MYEINRLRARLTYIQKNVVEYNMTVTDARALLKEIDELLKIKQEPLQQVVVNESTVINRIIDGGVL